MIFVRRVYSHTVVSWEQTSVDCELTCLRRWYRPDGRSFCSGRASFGQQMPYSGWQRLFNDSGHRKIAAGTPCQSICSGLFDGRQQWDNVQLCLDGPGTNHCYACLQMPSGASQTRRRCKSTHETLVRLSLCWLAKTLNIVNSWLATCCPSLRFLPASWHAVSPVF